MNSKTKTITGIIALGLGLLLQQVNAQSSQPFANCISLFMAGKAVQLSEDEDCNSSQWQEAIQYYKANGYPHEDSYMDFGYGKFIELDSDKWMQDKAELDMD